MEPVTAEFKHDSRSLRWELFVQLISFPATFGLWLIVMFIVSGIYLSSVEDQNYGISLILIVVVLTAIYGIVFLVFSSYAYTKTPFYHQRMQIYIDSTSFILRGETFIREKNLSEFIRIKVKSNWIKFYFNQVEAYIIPASIFSKEQITFLQKEEITKHKNE